MSVNPTDGSCWVADTYNDRVIHLAADGTQLWQGGAFYQPWSVSVNPVDGSCWVCDSYNYEAVHLAADGTELWRGGGVYIRKCMSVNPTDGSCWVADPYQSQVAHLIIVPDVTQVEIDIKPGSYPNSVNLGSRGVVPLAILSSGEFDATQVDAGTVTFAGAGVAVRGKGSRYLAHEEDVNGDYLLDLVVQVETENLDPGGFQDGYACVSGQTYGGEKIEGCDEITVVPLE